MDIYLNIYEVLELCKMLFPFNTLLQLFTIFFICVSFTWLYHLHHMQEKINFI